jgi:LysR family transcriptional regulator, hydrogen peroxide-inducible genes activator
MTFVQLEYVVALQKYRHFAVAAEHCYVTQPTLSMQIQKLESELGIQIFDRSKHPISTTEMGEQLITQAKKILEEKTRMEELIHTQKGTLIGELKIAIIPTLAPYLLPLFIQSFTTNHPHVKLVVSEMTTNNIISRLREGKIDIGILVTPLNDQAITEHVLFYEELVAYVSNKNGAYKKTYVLPQDIDPEKLWLLEEGHCFRSQILNLCELRRASREGEHFEYEAGSFETLRRIVELNDGITVLPQLATFDLNKHQQQLIRHFKEPAPMREVSLVVHRDFVKKRLIEVLKREILAGIPEKVKSNKKNNVIPI